jgi:hypothetical protein
MSGQPLQYPDDAKKFRKAYMATLQLQQDINQKNYEANTLYRRTGVVPTQITDYRSTSEKLADVIKLRIMIRSQLRQIADAQNAEDIAQSLTADQLVFASQHMDSIIKELKPQYKFGVLKDIFMNYLKNYMTKTETALLATVGLPSAETPARSAPASVAGSNDSFFNENAIETIKFLVEREKSRLSQGWLADSVLDALDEIQKLDFADDFTSRLEQVTSAQVQDEITRLYTAVKQAIPPPEWFAFQLQQMNQRRGDENAFQNLLEEFLQAIKVDDGIFRMKDDAESILDDYFIPRNVAVGTSKKIPTQKEGEPLDPKILLPIPDDLFADRGKQSGARKKALIQKKDLVELYNSYKRNGILRGGEDDGNRYSVDELYDIFEANLAEMKVAYEAQQPNVITVGNYRPFGTGGVNEYDFPIRNPRSPPSRRNADSGAEGVLSSGSGAELRRSGAEGEGLRQKVKKGIKGRGVDYAKGIDPLPKYAPLGQYYINQQKLKDDIVTCCRADGRSVSEWKAKRVSLPLANLIRKLVNKGKPTFDEISELSDEDKHILGEFARKAKLDIDVPHSTTSREDLNQFEIMKGEIMAGNDSKELIKSFKLLIVKLTHQGRLPKGQGKEILMELASLGY